MSIRKARDWRGTKYQLSLCTADELANILAVAINTRNQLNKFIDQVQGELLGLKSPPDPHDVA
jgi:hypothetical protein